MAKVKKLMTIDDLARMAQSEFSRIHETHKVFIDEFDRIRSDIRDIKTTLGPLVRIVGAQEREISDLNIRLHRVERKVGIEK